MRPCPGIGQVRQFAFQTVQDRQWDVWRGRNYRSCSGHGHQADPWLQMAATIRCSWAKEPWEIRSIEFNRGKVVWLEIGESVVRVSPNNFPRVYAGYIAWPIDF